MSNDADLWLLPAEGTITLLVITAVISALLGVFGKKVGEVLLRLIAAPFKLICGAFYRRIAPRNPFSISMRTYKRTLARSSLTRLENPVGPSLAVPLEHAFAPLKLQSATEQENVDLFSYLAPHPRCIVLGGPGTGKTTLMKNLITSILHKRCVEELNSTIPVFISLRDLARKRQSVQQAIVSAFADYHFPGADAFVESSLQAGLLVIVLDGLDEVGVNRTFVVERVTEFCRFDSLRNTQNRVIVTCREHAYHSMDLHEVIPETLRVEPFTNHHMRMFLEGWPVHKGRNPISLYAIIQSDPHIRDICRNPLLLTILTGLYLDTDNFEMPSSRERFYEATVDELLIRRQARRGIDQKFEPGDKRRILEAVALERLETVGETQDPEDLNQEVLFAKARKILQDDLDFHGLMKELVEVNGILRPTSDGHYTCAHRSIQEYLAAREAIRHRRASAVVATFIERPELVEVLYFYCGLLDNLPTLQSIVEMLGDREKWLAAGRSLLYMKEAPNAAIVSYIAHKLQSMITENTDASEPLQVLASLASRQDQSFGPAVECFTATIDRMFESDKFHASALGSAIATSPELALRLIPALLKHTSHNWRALGVKLLRDIGTDESLDRLVLLLTHPEAFIRAQAAFVLAEMVIRRNGALRQRSSLLPQRKDPKIWPLERYFPGSIAIPMVQAIADYSSAELSPAHLEPRRHSLAITSAVYVVMSLKASRPDEKTLQWSKIMRDVVLRAWRRRIAHVLITGGLVASSALIVTWVGFSMTATVSGRPIAISLSTNPFRRIDSIAWSQFRDAAEKLKVTIDSTYPPNASGWKRVLPWNWQTEPTISNAVQPAYDKLADCTSGRKLVACLVSTDGIAPLATITADTYVQKYQQTAALLGKLGAVTKDRTMMFVPARKWIVAVVWLGTVGIVFVGALGILRGMSSPGRSKRHPDRIILLMFMQLQMWMVNEVARIGDLPWNSLVSWLPVTPILAFFLGQCLDLVNWPKNSLLASIDELTTMPDQYDANGKPRFQGLAEEQ